MPDRSGPAPPSSPDSSALPAHEPRPGSLEAALAGAGATFAGIGLARFAYVPLFPVMVAAGWIDGSGAGLVGAGNLTGYLLGVLGGCEVGWRFGTARALDLGMAATALSFAACGWNGGLLWLAFWRAVAGAAGGILMALAGPAVQSVVAPAWRGLAGGIVIAGVGSGIVVSAFGVPPLLAAGLPATWLGLAAIVLALWALVRPRWPDPSPLPPAVHGAGASAGRLILTYGLAGAGMVPDMIYLADLIVRGRGYAFAVANVAWLLFGAGAVTGTLAAGHALDRWGGIKALRFWLALQAVALALVLVPVAAVLLAGAFLGGLAGIGATAVALGRAREIAGERAGIVWQRATAGYAVAQAATALALALLFATTGSHLALFAIGLACSIAAVATASIPMRTRSRPDPG